MPTNNTSSAGQKKQSIGAFYKRTSQNTGGEFFSGFIEMNGEKVEFIAFPNSYKTEAKHPDYKIFLSEPRNEVVAGKPPVKAPARTSVVNKPVRRPVPTPESDGEFAEDDASF